MITEDILTYVNEIIATGPMTPEITPILLAYGGQMREGMSPTRVAANIIARQGEFGGNYSKYLPSGQRNMMNDFIIVMTQEIFKEIRLNARVETGGQIGSTKIEATGANAGGPFTAIGTTVAPYKTYGVIL